MSAQADLYITDLYNTGVDAVGKVLPNGSLGDHHYTLESVPNGSTNDIIVHDALFYPTNGTNSNWISPYNVSFGSYGPLYISPNGYYDYKTSFNVLGGFDPSTTKISGVWSSDNNGVKILLNGLYAGSAPTRYDQFGVGFAPFCITSGFKVGLNTLDFIVYQDGGSPTALNVVMNGAVQAIPEPEEWVMMLAGFGLVGWQVKRKQKKAVPTTK